MAHTVSLREVERRNCLAETNLRSTMTWAAWLRRKRPAGSPGYVDYIACYAAQRISPESRAPQRQEVIVKQMEQFFFGEGSALPKICPAHSEMRLVAGFPH